MLLLVGGETAKKHTVEFLTTAEGLEVLSQLLKAYQTGQWFLLWAENKLPTAHDWESKNTTKNAKLFLYLRSVLRRLPPPEISSGVFFEPVPSSHVSPTVKPPAEPHQGPANR